MSDSQNRFLLLALLAFNHQAFAAEKSIDLWARDCKRIRSSATTGHLLACPDENKFLSISADLSTKTEHTFAGGVKIGQNPNATVLYFNDCSTGTCKVSAWNSLTNESTPLFSHTDKLFELKAIEATDIGLAVFAKSLSVFNFSNKTLDEIYKGDHRFFRERDWGGVGSDIAVVDGGKKIIYMIDIKAGDPETFAVTYQYNLATKVTKRVSFPDLKPAQNNYGPVVWKDAAFNFYGTGFERHSITSVAIATFKNETPVVDIGKDPDFALAVFSILFSTSEGITVDLGNGRFVGCNAEDAAYVDLEKFSGEFRKSQPKTGCVPSAVGPQIFYLDNSRGEFTRLVSYDFSTKTTASLSDRILPPGRLLASSSFDHFLVSKDSELYVVDKKMNQTTRLPTRFRAQFNPESGEIYDFAPYKEIPMADGATRFIGTATESDVRDGDAPRKIVVSLNILPDGTHQYQKIINGSIASGSLDPETRTVLIYDRFATGSRNKLVAF